MTDFEKDGFRLFDATPEVTAWSEKAAHVAREVVNEPELREMWLRHQETWFVGVDALPNALDGSIDGAVLSGPWEDFVTLPATWHKAQVSVVYEGYPKQDAEESDANHRFRIKRAAAHVDGILLEEGRRYLREPHSFILGLPLGESRASPLVIWPGSHLIMRDALRELIGCDDPKSVDLTDRYKAARARVFEQIEPVEVHATIGQSILLHRHMLHGVAPWKTDDTAPKEGRMVAYFRPEYAQTASWLSEP